MTLADQIPKTTALLFLTIGRSTPLPGATQPSIDGAADTAAAAEWFLKPR
jgi:hypothetical protein